MRQITTAIQTRRFLENREEQSRVSWQTRILAQYISAGYMSDGKSENKAFKEAGKIAYDEIERLALSAAQAQAAEDDASSYPGGIPPRASVEEVAEKNANGSYERFMMTVGNGAKRG
jgi:hypothetical protein